MRPFFIVIVFLLASTKPHACGWWPETDLYFFYNLFDQTNISGAEYYPFLRSDDHTFYEMESDSSISNQGNLREWKKLLPKWMPEQISLALNSESDEDFEQLWAGKKSAVEISAKQYMQFARKCSDFFQYRKRDSWDYQDILDNEIPDVNPLLEDGMKLFKNEKDKSLQLRYAYQLIRIFHYSKQYQDAIDFFNDKVASNFEKNELYYYALDQVGGCYYSLENYDYAAYIFIQVFNHSLDRKRSAFLSYNFCTNQEGEGKTYFEQPDDTLGYLVMKNLRSFSDDLDGVHELMNAAPADERTELLFMRAVNNLERRIWPTFIGMEKKQLPNLEEQDKKRIADLDEIGRQQYANAKVTNKNFWLLSSSYLAFLNNDLTAAKQKLSQLKGSSFEAQKKILSQVYDVFSWHHISDPEEKYIAPIADAVISDQPFNRWDALRPAWKYLILDQVAHLYYLDGKLAKAFLIHNRVETIDAIFSLSLIDDLLSFVDQKDKNDFEEILMRRTSNLPGNTSVKDYLLYVKGLYYLQQGDAKTASTFLYNNPINNYPDETGDMPISDIVYATIFSNNTMECFSCTDSIMVDSVYLASLFSFIQPSFSKAELATYLIKLDSLTKDPKPWKNKLAHYLLANYYFNVSNSGYFRGTLSGESNCCHYHYFFNEYDHHTVASDLIDRKEGYNLLDIEDHYKSDNGFAKKALDHYNQVIAKSEDRELNARCLYMMAKCELNEYYNIASDLPYEGYDGTVDADTKPYKTSFKQLKKEYKDTKFYQKIIQECSFFRYYCSL